MGALFQKSQRQFATYGVSAIGDGGAIGVSMCFNCAVRGRQIQSQVAVRHCSPFLPSCRSPLPLFTVASRSLPSSFKGAVLVGGAPLMQFRGLRATLRVSGSAWRLDVTTPSAAGTVLRALLQIPVPRQYRQSLNGGPSSVVVLQTSEGERYRWIRAEGAQLLAA